MLFGLNYTGIWLWVSSFISFFPPCPILIFVSCGALFASRYVSALSKQTSNNSKLIVFIYLGRLVLCCHMTL